jgi:hypothetical protein
MLFFNVPVTLDVLAKTKFNDRLNQRAITNANTNKRYPASG